MTGVCVEFERVMMAGGKEDPHGVKTMQFDAVWNVEGLLQPSMVVKSSKRPNHLTPVWNAFSALGWVADHFPAFEHQHVDARFCKPPRAGGPGRTCPNDDDGPVLYLRHAITWFSNQSLRACLSSDQRQDLSLLHEAHWPHARGANRRGVPRNAGNLNARGWPSVRPSGPR